MPALSAIASCSVGSVMAYPMGEAKLEPLRVDFDRRLKLEFHGSDLSSDAGLLPYRELDDALGLTELGGAVLSETRRGKNTRHLLVALLRQSVFGRLAGYEDVNDAERLSQDPVMRTIVDRKGLDRLAASASRMGRFETGCGKPLCRRRALVETPPDRPTRQVCAAQVEVRPHSAKWSRGRVSHRLIGPIKSGPRPIVTAQGRNRGRMPSVLPLSAIGRSHLGNPG